MNIRVFKNQFVRNTSSNLINLISSIVIGIILLPYLVSNIGLTAYGLIPLSMVIIEYMGLINQSLSMSVNRYLSLAIQKNDLKEANKIYSTAMILILSLVSIQIIIFTYPLLNIEKLIDIGEIKVIDVVWLFYLVFLSYLLSLVTSIFNVTLYAKNRLDHIQISNFIRVVGRAFLIFFFFKYYDTSLFFVGLATLIPTLLSLLYSYFTYRKLTPEFKFKLSAFDKNKIKSLLNLGGWLIVNQVGFLLLSRIDILLVNKLIGANESGEYAIVVQLSNLIRTCLSVMSLVVGPYLFNLYSTGDLDKLKNSAFTFTKVITFITVIPISFIVINRSEIVNIWLGQNFFYVENLVCILIIPLFLNIGVTPLFTINTILEKVKIPGMLSLIFGFSALTISYFMILYTDLGIYSVAISSIAALTIKNGFFTPIYTAKILGLRWYYFLLVQLNAAILFIIAIGVSLVVRWGMLSFGHLDLTSLIITLVLYSIIMLFIIYVFLSVKDKSSIFDVFIGKVKF